MDPVPPSLLEIPLDDGAVYGQPGALPSALLPADWGAPCEELHNPKLFQHGSHMSPEIFRGDMCFSSGPHQSKMNYSSVKSATVAELLKSRVELDQMIQHPVQHPFPSQVYFLQADQSTFNLNLMSAVGPSPVKLHTSSPFGDRVQPRLMPLLSSPSALLNSRWKNLSLLPPLPHPSFCLNPGMPAPIISPAEFWSGPYLPPQHSPYPFKPDVPPSWCSCPQVVPFHQTWSPAMVLRSGGSKQSIVNVTPVSKKSEGQVKTQAASSENAILGLTDMDGHLLSLEEELFSYETFRNQMMTTEFPKIPEYVGGDKEWKWEESRNMQIGNRFFMEYLDELCNDEDFVRNVEPFLNVDFLDYLLSSDLGTMDFFALDLQQETIPKDKFHPLSGNKLVTTETSLPTSDDNRGLHNKILDPPSMESELNQTGLHSPQEVRSKECGDAFSPLLSTHLLGSTNATPESHMNNRFPTDEDIYSSANACSFLMNSLSSHSGPQKQISQKTIIAGKKDVTETKICGLRCSQRLLGSSEKEKHLAITAGEKKQVENCIIKTAKVTPRHSANCENRRRPTGRRQLFKKEESLTEANENPEEPFLKTANEEDKKLTEEMHEAQVPKGKPTNFCREMVENSTCLSKNIVGNQRVQSATTEERELPTPLAKGKTGDTETRRKVEINTKKTVREPQSLPAASPTKRSRKTKDAESCEDKVSSIFQPTNMCPQSERESVMDEKCSQTARKAPPKEDCKAKCPNSRPSCSKKTQKRGPKSSSIQCPESGKVTRQQCNAVLETKTGDLKPKVSKWRKNKAEVNSRSSQDVERDKDGLLREETEQLNPNHPVKNTHGCQNRKRGVHEHLTDNVETGTENPLIEFNQETQGRKAKTMQGRKRKPNPRRKRPRRT